MKKGKMIKHLVFVILLKLSFPFAASAYTEDPFPLKKLDLKELIATAPGWQLTGTIWFDPLKKKKIIQEKGDNILFSNTLSSSSLEVPLGTGNSLYIEFDYMLASDTRLQLTWGQNDGLLLSTQDDQTAVSSINGALTGQSAFPPRTEAGRAAGLWQHARIWLSSNGMVYGIVLNDVVVHRNLRIPQAKQLQVWKLAFTPNGSVALRNLRYAMPAESSEALEHTFDFPTLRDIIVSPAEHTLVQRCFIQDSGFKRTYCVAVGDPGGIHYVIDQEQANILGMWRGEFFDASTMWISRGEPQIAQPLGNIIWFDRKPVLAKLDNAGSVWPDFMQQGLSINGYELDGQKRPAFLYTFNGAVVSDRVVPDNHFRSLQRTISVTEVHQPDLWMRLASGRAIKAAGKGRYIIGDMEYYLQLLPSKDVKTKIRVVNGITELLVPIIADTKLTYTINW